MSIQPLPVDEGAQDPAPSPERSITCGLSDSAPRAKVTHLMVLRAGRPEHTPEAEPVIVEAQDDTVRLVLDDGEVIDFDAVELRAALNWEAA